MFFNSVAFLISLFTLKYAMYYNGGTFSASPNVIVADSNTELVQTYYFNDYTVQGLDYPVDYSDTLYVGYNSDNDYLVRIDHDFHFSVHSESSGYMYNWYHWYDIYLPLKTFDDYTSNYCVDITVVGACVIESYSWSSLGASSNGNTFLSCENETWSESNSNLDLGDMYDRWSVSVTISLLESNSLTYYNNGYNNGYSVGYNEGLSQQSGWNLSNYLYGIVNIPILYLRSMFDFELFGGISLLGVMLSLITISIVVFVIKKFIL